MSSTKIHDRMCVLIALPSFVLGVLDSHFLLVGLGSLGGLLVSPDWDWDGSIVQDKETGRKKVLTEATANRDQRQIRRIYSVVIRRWPKFLQYWFFLYARLFGHRKISHSLRFGTLTRLLWLIVPLPLAVLEPKFLLVWLGLWIADAMHVILDRI